MLIEEGYPDSTGKMKQFASWFTHGVEGGAKLRKAIYEARDPSEIVEAVDLFFARPAAESERSEEAAGAGPWLGVADCG
jgi:tRNA-dihydrouridine synthase